ncbi:hypothetical protein PI124_g23167 [Phytophthora idaei]|nr:hypothetical protein PI124_g23167 [Phytophthora idaei]
MVDTATSTKYDELSSITGKQSGCTSSLPIHKEIGFGVIKILLTAAVGSKEPGSNNEVVLLPVNEPTFGTKCKSQIQTYVEQNVGAGLQHKV